MKVYTFYTPSHVEIYEEYFLKSFHRFLKPMFELYSELGTQKTQNGDFTDPMLGSSMDDKLMLLKKAICENDGYWFLYSDCDVQFFDGVLENIKSYLDRDDLDMICQEDCGTICAGFLLIKSSKKMYDFFDFISKERHKFNNDQIAINHYRSYLNYEYFPKNLYYTVGNYNGGQVWLPNHGIPLPNKIFMHHANFTISVENKLKMMDDVKKFMTSYDLE